MASPTTTTTPPLSLDDWQDLPEDEPGELVDGRIVEEEMPDYVHELVVAFFIRVLGTWIVPRGGLVAGSEAKFQIGPGKGRKPDLSVFLPGRPLPRRRGIVRVAPDVVLEVISPTPRDGRRDRVDKVDDYAAFGVHYYWMVDPELRTLEILELGHDGRYVRALGASAGILDPVPGCDGLRLDLDALWAEVDRLPEDDPPARG